MKNILTTFVAFLFSGMVCAQEGSNIEGLDSISATVDNEILNIVPQQKSEEQKLEEIIKKAIEDNKKYLNPIGEIIIKNKTVVFNDALVEKLDKRIKESNQILHNLYLKFLEKEKADIRKYKSINIKVKGDTDKTNYTSEVVNIDSVKFDIQEGMLEFIKVYLNDGTTYTNKKAPIALVHLENRGYDRLYDSDNNKFVLLKNVVTFDVNKRFGYLPDNKVFRIINDVDTVPGRLILTKNSDINSLVNFTAYSDLLGLLGDEPNALVNFEANAKFYLHRLNIWDRFIYIFPTFQPHFHYNRVDSKFDSLIIENNKINPTEIFRRHNYAVGFDLSAFRYDWKPANSLEIKGGYLYTSSKLYIQDNKTNAINHIKYIEANLKSKVIDNFGIDLNLKQMWQKLNDNQYFESTSEEMMALRGGIYYASPETKGDDKIFLRFTNYLVWDDRKQDFSQIQLGFTKALNF